MMKKLLILQFALLCVLFKAQAAERIFITTDRSSYISGDRVWCSLFCVDDKGSLSDQSAVSYIELISSEGTVAEEKAALLNGRGCTTFNLPANLPSGNYRLVAYTSSGGVSESGSRIISVYNTFTTARVKDGVRIESSYSPLEEKPVTDPLLAVSTPAMVGAGRDFNINLQSSSPVTLAVSLSLCDGLDQQENTDIGTFLSSGEKYPQTGEIEYDGEIVRGRVSGAKVGTMAVLSSSGSPSDSYISSVRSDGTLAFPTGNIFGNRELVCEVIGGAEDSYIVFDSPFRNPSAGDIQKLVLSPSMNDPLVSRKERIRLNVKADTLYNFLPKREDLLFEGMDWEVYNLDDYTRFPTVSEVLVEIVQSVGVGRSHGKKALYVLSQDGTESKKTIMYNVLAMLDGVIVSDLDILMNFDAMLIQNVEVCRQGFVIGQTPYNGAINFVTFKNYVTTVEFPSNVRVLDYKGVGFPLAYFGEKPSGNVDNRELLYWNPVLDLNGSASISVSAPSYQGRFRLEIQGMASNGEALKAITYIDVR